MILKLGKRQKMLVVEVLSALLILLFLYAAMAKILSPSAAKHDMLNQPFPRWFTKELVWLIPGLEIFLVVCLVFDRTRTVGLYGCLVLLSMFTVYAGLILMNVFPYVPCGCGGVIRHLSWPQHLIFNLFFAGISGVALFLKKQLGNYKYEQFNF